MRAKAVAVLTFLLFSFSSGQAATQKVLYSFTGGLDGGQPYAGVIFDPAGNLYGVTEWGGVTGSGTVFQLTPSPSGWTETVLYNFTGGSDGFDPVGGLALDEAGNLYGTTAAGGDPYSQCGTVFKLSPSDSGWTFTVLHTFTGGKDGCYPISNLSVGTVALVGTTLAGGTSNQGTFFNLPISGGNDSVVPFTRNNGNQPYGNVNSWGYGTTYSGGRYGDGNVYELSHLRIISKHVFNPPGKAGYRPMGDLLPLWVAGVRTMYGTTSAGGVGGRGTAYRLTASQTKDDVWLISSLHSFSGPDGLSPNAGLTADSAGNLYGTTEWGGTDPGYDGTVFKLTPAAKKKWTHTLLHSFTGGTDGGNVTSGVVLDNAGNLYGTTSLGGAYNQGVVYEVTP